MKKDKTKTKINVGVKENLFFLILICGVFIFGMYGFIKSPRNISTVENRTLAQFSHMTIKDFLNGTFQDNFENALSDQFLMSEKIRINYGQIINNLPSYGINNLFCTNRYIEAPSSTKSRYEFFDCDDHIVARPHTMSEDDMKIYNKNLANYNRIDNLADVYYYYIMTCNDIDFETGEIIIDGEEMLRKGLKGKDNLGVFKIDDYETYKKYFYKTDAHWNYDGSYNGYLDIARMMSIKNPIERPKVLTNHDIFYGSFANAIQYYDIKEEFYYYDYDFPEHDTYVNGKKSDYDHLENYKKHNYPEDTSFYYDYVYGTNSAEVMFDYHNPEAENLLIISNSFGNPIKSLIAQHFNKTYAVDLRHYKKIMKKDFIISDYIKEHNIKKVLFILISGSLYSEELNQGLEL